jgi:hypothetical protein
MADVSPSLSRLLRYPGKGRQSKTGVHPCRRVVAVIGLHPVHCYLADVHEPGSPGFAPSSRPRALCTAFTACSRPRRFSWCHRVESNHLSKIRNLGSRPCAGTCGAIERSRTVSLDLGNPSRRPGASAWSRRLGQLTPTSSGVFPGAPDELHRVVCSMDSPPPAHTLSYRMVRRTGFEPVTASLEDSRLIRQTTHMEYR